MLFRLPVHGLLLLTLVGAPQDAEALDLIDLIDQVDLVTRAEIEEALARPADLTDLPILVPDLALPPRTRDRAVALVVSFSRRWFEERDVLEVWAGLVLRLELFLLPPMAVGPPPEERERVARCIRLHEEEEPRLRAARFTALGCGTLP